MAALARVVCVCGLAAEARIARAAGFAAVVGAGNRERTALLAAKAVAGAECVVSFGIAGGLAPHLQPGALLLASEVIGVARRWTGRPDLAGKLARQIGAARGPVLGAHDILASRHDKARAWHATQALAVDLESVAVAEAAASAGIPFLVLRAIADPAGRDLPPAALLKLSETGMPVPTAVLGSLLRQQRQLPALLALALETRRAFAALVPAAHALRRLLDGDLLD